MVTFPIKNGKLQGDLNAAGRTILNLDLTGLGLTRASVGLGNVDNTSDLGKPLSSAAVAALALKEPNIAAGTTAQFWRGDKTWRALGALALQDGRTTLPELSSIGANDTTAAAVAALRSDYASSFAGVALNQYGAEAVGTLTVGGGGGVADKANAGVLLFQNTTNAVIMTNGATPIIFATTDVERARLMLGLSVGSTVDPGIGGIKATGTVTAAQFVGGGAGLTGLDGPFTKILINGTAGAGYIDFGAQSTAPTATSLAHIYNRSTNRIAFGHSGSQVHSIIFDNALLSTNRTFQYPDTDGVLAVGQMAGGFSTGWTGTGDATPKAVSSATTGDVAAAVKLIIDALLDFGILGA